MKKVFTLVFLALFIFLVYSLSRQIYDALQAGKRLDQATTDLSLLQKKNSELKKKLEEVGSPQFIEQQARDKLNFSRPNEVVLVIPEEVINRVLSGTPTPTLTPLPPYQTWLKLFSK